MRHQKTIPLGENRSATVLELRPKDVRRLIGETKSLSSFELSDLFGDQFENLLAIAGDLIVMPEGETVEDLSFSEVEEVKEALLEVNTSFLALLAKMGLNLSFDLIQPESKIPSEPSETSTEPLAD